MRITRTIADDTAENMVNEQFNKKINELYAKQNKFNEGIAEKYIPKDVLKMSNKYPDFIKKGYEIHVDCRVCGGTFIYTKNEYPTPDRAIQISEKERLYIDKINDDIYKTLCDMHDIKDRISDALLALRTLEKVKKEFPEAVKYISYKEKSFKELEINDLRDMFK